MSSNLPKQQSNIFDTDIISLIEEVKQRECLWNRLERSKGDRYQMGKAWTEISDILGIPSDSCRSRWRNLRDVFRREMRRDPISEVEEYKGSWKFFRPLWFLHRPGVDDTEDEVNTHTIHLVKHEPMLEQYLDDEDPIEEVRPKRRKRDSDSDVLFLKSLAPYLKMLDPVRKLVIRNKMQDILINELSLNSTSDS